MVGTRGDFDAAVDEALLDAEPWQLTESQLVEGVPELTRQIHELEAARVRLVGEMNHRNVVPDKAHPSLTNWLAANPAGLLSPGEAARIVDLAKALRAEPEVAEA